nr:uncharacterized protein LOC116776499 [Danaus plexippus plexippus]
MAAVFWDSRGVSYIDCLEKRQKTITRLCYTELLGRLNAELQKKRPHLVKKRALPPRRRTGSHLRCRRGQIGSISLRTAAPSTLSPDLAPGDFFFPNLKMTKKKSKEAVIAATEACFEELQKAYLSSRHQHQEHRWIC